MRCAAVMCCGINCVAREIDKVCLWVAPYCSDMAQAIILVKPGLEMLHA